VTAPSVDAAVEIKRPPLERGEEGPPAPGLPPGPRLPTLVQAALLAKRPEEFLERCRTRYGRCFTLTAPPYGRALYIWEPRDVHTVFRGDPDVFMLRQVRKAHRLMMGPESIMLHDGDRHLRDRRLMSTRFHGEYLGRYPELIRTIAERELDTWPEGVPFPLRPRLLGLTLDAIIQVVLGIDTNEERRAYVRSALVDVIDLNPTLLIAVPAVRRDLGPRSPWGKFKRMRAALFGVLYEEIRRAREPGYDGDCVLSALVQAVDEDGNPLSDDWVLSQVMTLLIAGHQTTATAIAWAFERLTHNPWVLDRLVASLDDSDEAYLQAVVHETLRARPIVAVTPRWLSAETEIAGRLLPAGSTVGIAQLLTQHDPDTFDEPKRFVPERYLNENPHPMTLVAFGGGPRRCLGASLAEVEMATVLRAVLERFEVTAARREDEAMTMPHVTLTPARGAEVVLKRRRRRGHEPESSASSSRTLNGRPSRT
jgi:cytochrome P450 family 135